MNEEVFDRIAGALSPNCLLDRKVIDIHTHMAGVGDTVKGLFASPKFISSPVFSSMLTCLKTPPSAATDSRIRQVIIEEVDGAVSIDYAVFLAMDGVYKNGKFVASETHLMIPNDYIIDLSRMNKKVLFGASVHPYREAREMLAAVKRCADEGAALFMWSPSVQQINPEDERCIPFYVCMAREGIPLLVHGGGEFTACTARSKAEYDDPARLKTALDIGVKVVAAHCASPSGKEVMAEGYWDTLLDMLRMAEGKRWDLYADISACCAPLKTGCLEMVKLEIEEGRISPKRFLYGSDFPMSSADIDDAKKFLIPGELGENMSGQGNHLDNRYRIMKDFGIHGSVFTNASSVLRL